MKMMTFQEIREATPDIFPSIDGLDDAFKNSVCMWFDSREVSDNDNFARFFQRILYRDFGQYLQLLRIEPGVAQYDWLVQTYAERMETRDSGSTTTTETSTTGETSKTHRDTSTEQTTLTDTRTLTTVTDEDVSDGSTRTDDLTDTNSGADTTVHGHAISTTSSGSSTAGGSDSTSGDHSSKRRELAKAAPQSISYASGFDTDDDMDWTYPSSQAETGESGEDESTTIYGRTDSTQGTSSVTNSGTDTYNKGTSVRHSGTQSTQGTKERDTTVTETHGGTQTTAITHGGSITDESTDSSEGSTTTDVTGSDIVKSIHTGRSVDLATLLDNATSFIVGSSAFEWMRRRLEPAFQGVL